MKRKKRKYNIGTIIAILKLTYDIVRLFKK